MSRNHTEKDKTEAKIETLINEKSNDLIRPVIAFVTFETQEGYERAKRYRENSVMVFEAAKEPTDVIWENVHITSSQILVRTLIVVGISILLLIGSFFIIFYLKRFLINIDMKYLNLNCDSFNRQISTDDMKLRYAMIDYYDFYYTSTGTMMTGALQ